MTYKRKTAKGIKRKGTMTYGMYVDGKLVGAKGKSVKKKLKKMLGR